MTEIKKTKHDRKVEEANRGLAVQKEGLTECHWRLNYHMMPPAGWMNDPNGLIHYKGEYHVFYQHDPFRAQQGPMHWGHARSRDLLHWEHLPVALSPSEPYDLVELGTGGGCWSGCAVEDGGRMVLFYTGHVDGRCPEEVQCLADSDDGIRFVKRELPVIPGPPEEGVFGFRDPKVWKHDGIWYMVVGSGKDGRGRALLYSSPDLQTWEYKGAATESDGTMGNMWECPDLFPAGTGEEHVLLYSPMNMGGVKTMYQTGVFDYTGCSFHGKVAERLDYGFDFYAPQTFLDGRGRRLLIGWMNIWGAKMPEQEHGWSGAFTIPREIKLQADGTIRMLPVEELVGLRGPGTAYSNVKLEARETRAFDGVVGDSLELMAVFDLSASDDRDTGHAAEFGLQVRCSEDGEEHTEIRYHTGTKLLQVDRSRSGQGDGGISEVHVTAQANGRLKLHLFLDRSSAELFVNDGRTTVTNRIYPAAGSQGIRFFCRSGRTILESLQAWELGSVWKQD